MVSTPGPRGSTALLLLLLAVGLALRVTALDAPPLDSHHVRQSDTASMARVMAREGTDLLHPRIAWAGPEAGTVESEFPLYQALVAVGWRALGEPVGAARSPSAAWARGVSVAAWLVGAFALIAWVRRRFGGPTWPFLLLYCLSPLSVVFSRSIQPDPTAVAFLLLGLERLDAAVGRRGPSAALSAGLAALFLGLAVAVKGTTAFWLVAALPLARVGRADRDRRWAVRGIVASAVVGASALGIAWYAYASTLGSDGATFGIWGPTAHKWGGLAVWLDVGRWAGIVGTFLGVTCTPVGAALAAAGLIAARWKRELEPFAWGIGGLGVAVIAVTEGFGLHGYYQLPAVAFVSVAAGWTVREGLATLRDAPLIPQMPAFLAVAGGLALGSSTVLAQGFVRDNLTLDRRPAAVARTAGALIPEGPPVVVVDRHAQTVLYAMDRRGWTRDAIAIDDLEWLEVDGAEYLLVTDTSASYWSDTFRSEIAARRPLVAQGPDWVLFRLFAATGIDPAAEEPRSPGPSPPEPASPDPPR